MADIGDFQHFIRTGWLPGIEDFIDGDLNLGEPFFDLNGNGVYDRGIDVFVMSPDPSINQDVNHSGVYDGPESYWEPPIPWDDINGNGTFDYKNSRHDPGEPFVDYNDNGIRDEIIADTQMYITRATEEPVGGGWIATAWEILDSTHLFVSESGKLIKGPERSPYTWDGQQNRPARVFGFHFRKSDSGVVCVIDAALFRDTLLLPLTGNSDSVRTHSVVYAGWAHNAQDTISFTRTVSDGATLDTPFGRYEGCLKIAFESPHSSDTTIANYFAESFIEFWIDRDKGLVAIYSDRIIHLTKEVFLARRYDSLPLPMTP
ncbi:MAG: hypothetical protein RBT76_14730 [candidate division Zixibacteria bacterium]|nr:hypothetical protein [candidate division Zixibacteria bacterium]